MADFATPPEESDYDFAGAAPVEDDAPIVLGAPDEEPVSYLGDVTEEMPEPAAEEPVVPSGPSPMQEWNDNWQQTLLQRKDDENARKAELLEQAKQDLEAFQQEREQKRQAKMSKNREDEQAKLEAIEKDLENDNSWQRVCKMVDMSHESTKAAADTKRMRDAMILLKNEPTRAEALTN